MIDPNRLVKAKDILAAPEVRRMCGIGPEDRHTLRRWRASRGFPEPIRVLRRKKGQHLELWSRLDVKAWLDANPPATNLIEPPA
jgi:predicted DNA-binding transcriptional regulator AlpA